MPGLHWLFGWPRAILARLDTLVIQGDEMNQHLTDLQNAVTDLDTKVDALIAFYLAVQQAAATEADLDALKATVATEAAKVAAVLPPPAS